MTITLNNDHIKLIADRGRALPDEVLAPLVASHVLATALGAPVAPVTTAPEPAAATDRRREKKRRNEYMSTKRRADLLIAFLRLNPGARVVDMQRGLNCHRNIVRAAVALAMQDGRIERREELGEIKYYVVEPVAQPAVLLTEQRIDGENKQRLVRVERRRGVAKRVEPMTSKQRRIALVEFVRANPGTQRGSIVAHLGCGVGQVQYALVQAERAGEIRMEGTRAYARYYARGYVNGAATQAVTA